MVIADGERLEAATGGLYDQGKAQLAAGRYGLAVAAFRRALGDQPNSVPLLNALAIAYAQLGRDDLALRYFERALEQDVRGPETLNNVGYWALQRGRLDLAARYLQRAAEQTPNDPTVQANLALVKAHEHTQPPPPPPAHAIPPQPTPLFRTEPSGGAAQRLYTQQPVGPA